MSVYKLIYLWFYEEIQSNMFPGGLIPVFLPDHEEPIHSYVDVDAYDNLLQLKEKEIIILDLMQ